jgi:hypothetical protein
VMRIDPRFMETLITERARKPVLAVTTRASVIAM